MNRGISSNDVSPEQARLLRVIRGSSRYTGLDRVRSGWDPDTSHTLLIVPRPYNASMSLPSVHRVLHLIEWSLGASVERFFPLSEDLADRIRSSNVSPWSLESFRPIQEFERGVVYFPSPSDLLHWNDLRADLESQVGPQENNLFRDVVGITGFSLPEHASKLISLPLFEGPSLYDELQKKEEAPGNVPFFLSASGSEKKEGNPDMQQAVPIPPVARDIYSPVVAGAGVPGTGFPPEPYMNPWPGPAERSPCEWMDYLEKVINRDGYQHVTFGILSEHSWKEQDAYTCELARRFVSRISSRPVSFSLLTPHPLSDFWSHPDLHSHYRPRGSSLFLGTLEDVCRCVEEDEMAFPRTWRDKWIKNSNDTVDLQISFHRTDPDRLFSRIKTVRSALTAALSPSLKDEIQVVFRPFLVAPFSGSSLPVSSLSPLASPGTALEMEWDEFDSLIQSMKDLLSGLESTDIPVSLQVPHDLEDLYRNKFKFLAT